jgi:serine/threonine protein kinase
MLQSVKIKPGERITLSSGIYNIECEIGTGGFGTVFKGQKEGKLYAIKLNRMWELLPDDREDIKKRIKLEFEISNTIFSEHLVHTFSLDEINENPILVMDYCPDGSLRNRIGKPFNQDELNRIPLQILTGLSILHSYQIVHRDIKPENVLFKKDKALLTDFGISANLKNRVTERNIRGQALRIFATLSYSPPEQSQKSIAFKTTGPTNDIFSFGVILYEIVAEGKLPYGDINDFEEDSKKVEKKKTLGEWDIKTLRKYTENKVLIGVIDKCLQPDPKMRFQSVNEIIYELESTKSVLVGNETDWKLSIISGYDEGKKYNLTNLSRYKNKRILTIGRFDEDNPLINDIAFRERSGCYISLHHGTLEFALKNNVSAWYLRDGQWYSKDGKVGWHLSRNGIEVNNKPVNQLGIELRHKDQIKIGETVLEVNCR